MGGMEVKHGETMQFLCENYGMETKSFRGPIVLKVYGSIWWSTWCPMVAGWRFSHFHRSMAVIFYGHFGVKT